MPSIFFKNAQNDKYVFTIFCQTGRCETWRWHYIIWFKSRATGTVPFFKTFFLFVQQSRLETLKSKTCELKHSTIKVSKFQKQIFLFSFEPKNEQNYFLNSSLASKMSQIKKMKVRFYMN